MPVILPEDKLDAWLSGEVGKEILVPYPADGITVWPISPRRNSPKNDDARMLEPVVVVPNQPRLDRDSML
jgi:putative SOS response-associated peptidase YedK